MNEVSAAENRNPALDERLNAFLGILAVEHAILDFRYVVDGRPLPRFDVFQRGFLGHLNSDGRVLRDEPGDLHGALDLPARSDDFLDEPDLVGPLGTELVAQEQMVHRVAPTSPAKKPEMRSAQWSNPALGFHLAEPTVLRSNDDVARQHHFDSDRKHDALHSSHDRLAAPISEPEDIDITFLQIPFFRLGTEELRHIQSGGKVASLCADYPDPEGVVVV